MNAVDARFSNCCTPVLLLYFVLNLFDRLEVANWIELVVRERTTIARSSERTGLNSQLERGVLVADD